MSQSKMLTESRAQNITIPVGTWHIEVQHFYESAIFDLELVTTYSMIHTSMLILLFFRLSNVCLDHRLHSYVPNLLKLRSFPTFSNHSYFV